MDVAEDAAESRLIEDDVAQRADGIHPEIEALAVAKREDVVEDAIVVRKIDGRPDADDQDMGNEGQIALIEEPFPEELEIDIRDIPARVAADESAHTDKDALKRIEMGYKAIALKNSRNVIIRDVSILHGGWFAILATGVDNFTIDNIKIDTNRDGIDVDACKNVRISNATVNSPFDDGICLKSSYGLGSARPTENVTITNSQVSGYDEGTLLDGTYKRTVKYTRGPTGRIKFGTESNGGFKNITISNCVFEYSRGLAIESVDGALIEDVAITNITMRDIVNAPIFVRLGRRARGPNSPPPGVINRVRISNVVASNVDSRHGVLVSGIPGHPIDDLRLSDVRIAYQGGGTPADAALEPEEKETEYPEPDMFGNMPAYGMYVRHAKNVSARDVVFTTDKPDARPAFRFDDVAGVDLERMIVPRTLQSLFGLRRVTDFLLRNSPGLPDKRLATAEKESF